ncbi:uncharacterized protein [Triticum aestivum]|uniref:uncharacterized protein n=1 Tax=Triticum aestivum TaxID=4565 RepID=UPI001D01C8B1|nr:uncharacterized protein LOC123043423 [Triticum aestivum]
MPFSTGSCVQPDQGHCQMDELKAMWSTNSRSGSIPVLSSWARFKDVRWLVQVDTPSFLSASNCVMVRVGTISTEKSRRRSGDDRVPPRSSTDALFFCWISRSARSRSLLDGRAKGYAVDKLEIWIRSSAFFLGALQGCVLAGTRCPSFVSVDIQLCDGAPGHDLDRTKLA